MLKRTKLYFLALVAALLVGCGADVEGKYTDNAGTTVTLKEGTANITVLGLFSNNVPYEVSGDEVTLDPENDPLTYRVTDDGLVNIGDSSDKMVRMGES